MEGKKGNQRPDFKQNNEFELDGKSWELHFLMQNFLAAYRFVLVLENTSLSVPTTVHEIEPSQNYLHDDESYGLIAYHIEN